MMRINLKHVVEIAGGLVIGALASDAVDGIIKIIKEAVVNAKNEGA